MLPSITSAYISLGSNLGATTDNLHRARIALQALPLVQCMRASSVYTTEPQEVKKQNFFANQVVELACKAPLGAEMLLAMLLGLEAGMGRVRNERYGPRLIDLDLLLFGNERIENFLLSLPHPRLYERAFVLVPLAELAPTLVLPCGQTVRQILARVPHKVEGMTILQ